MANPWTKNKPASPKVVEDANFPSLQNVLLAATTATTATASSYALATTTTNIKTKTFFHKNDDDENNDLKPGWVYISWTKKDNGTLNAALPSLNGAQAPPPYTYIYGPDVFNAYLEDCFVREERSDYIWRRRVWRHHNHINQVNATLGDLSPYWGS